MRKKINIHQHMNCIQMVLEVICSQLKIEFSNMFIDSWDFFYETADDAFSPTGLSSRSPSSPSRHNRLGVEEIVVGQSNDFSETLIRSCIEQGDILLADMDSYHCPWHRGYKKTHIKHYFLIVGIQESGLCCNDPYLSPTEKRTLSYSEVRYINRLSYFKKVEDIGAKKAENVLVELIRDEKRIIKMFEMIEAFSQQLLQLNDPNKLFDYAGDVYLCTLARELKFIADSRIQVGYLLDKFNLPESLHNEQITQVSDMFYHCGDQWNHLNSIFIKLFCISSQFEKAKWKIAEYTADILKTDRMALEQMKVIRSLSRSRNNSVSCEV